MIMLFIDLSSYEFFLIAQNGIFLSDELTMYFYQTVSRFWRLTSRKQRDLHAYVFILNGLLLRPQNFSSLSNSFYSLIIYQEIYILKY